LIIECTTEHCDHEVDAALYPAAEAAV